MAEMKNICGKIPLELHEKVREEIELTESSTQKFIEQVIEEHFMKEGASKMAARTLAVQVTEELFGRMKKVIVRKGCKQKDFLIEIIEKALDEEERIFRQEDEETKETQDEEENAESEAEEESESAETTADITEEF
ncbi:hypothetical protein [Hespellia stercorisuis]|uniref:Uncharacterized protein n=1 Tax=Hespellia stercorisuis DSM 15480 TaxID=1121950 RepID=A0A1M6TBD5_9FIRM|nr:hypothetical protein [Hespellia stercorisuis]SHK54280.1 hypothetical protein SAMN02745243_03182 [Hespellia stercorisuis DSM 15480]